MCALGSSIAVVAPPRESGRLPLLRERVCVGRAPVDRLLQILGVEDVVAVESRAHPVARDFHGHSDVRPAPDHSAEGRPPEVVGREPGRQACILQGRIPLARLVLHGLPHAAARGSVEDKAAVQASALEAPFHDRGEGALGKALAKARIIRKTAGFKGNRRNA